MEANTKQVTFQTRTEKNTKQIKKKGAIINSGGHFVCNRNGTVTVSYRRRPSTNRQPTNQMFIARH